MAMLAFPRFGNNEGSRAKVMTAPALEVVVVLLACGYVVKQTVRSISQLSSAA